MCKANYAGTVKRIMSLLLLTAESITCCVLLLCAAHIGINGPAGANYDVMTLTMRRNYVNMTADGETQEAGPQNRSAAAARMPESASGKGDRSAVCGIGFFRRARSGSGEVRNDPAGRNRWSDGQRQRRRFRLFTSLFLSGAKLAGLPRFSGFGSPEAGTTARSQVEFGGDGFYRK